VTNHASAPCDEGGGQSGTKRLPSPRQQGGGLNGFTDQIALESNGLSTLGFDAAASRKRSFLTASGSYNNGDPTVTKVSRLLLDTS